jgi:glutathione S-transferase
MITLYHSPRSRSTRSLWLLNELGLEFELVTMPLDLKILRAPEYLAVHPLGRVPCLIDGDRTIFESGAISQYLCEVYDGDGSRGLQRPPGHPERFELLQWVHYAETIAVHGASLMQQRVFIAEPERSPAVQNLESRRLAKAVGVVDRHLNDGRPCLLASGFSAADTNVGYSVALARSFLGLDAFPNARAYLERLEQRPAFQAALESARLDPANPAGASAERPDQASTISTS